MYLVKKENGLKYKQLYLMKPIKGISFKCCLSWSIKNCEVNLLIVLQGFIYQRGSDGSVSKFLTRFGSGEFLLHVSCQIRHLCFEFELGKFPLKISNFSTFFPSGKKNLIRSGQKIPGSRTGQRLIICKSKVPLTPQDPRWGKGPGWDWSRHQDWHWGEGQGGQTKPELKPNPKPNLNPTQAWTCWCHTSPGLRYASEGLLTKVRLGN